MTTVTRLTMLPVERKDIEHQSAVGRQYLTESIADLARLWITEGKPSRAELTISGYDDDPRELYEIPEVCQWANWIENEFPVLPFFLTDTALDRFTGWLCGPMSREALTSPEFGKKFTDTKMECVTKAIAESSEFLKRMGADGPTISKFYFQIMAMRATQEEQEKENPIEEPQTSIGKTILKAAFRFFLWGVVSSSIFALLAVFLFDVPVESGTAGCVGVVIGTFFFFDTFRRESDKIKKNTNDKVYGGVKRMESQKRDPESTGSTAAQKEITKIKQVIDPAPEIICSNCGNVGLPKDRFCRKCGNPFKYYKQCGF